MRRGMEGGGRLEGGDAGGRRFSLDRSNLRVLLCDKDPKSSQEVLRLLNNCSYQVTTVRTARQVIDMLTNGNEIDIVLCEVDLPIAEGLKMLKCISRKKDLMRIPIIMMSSRDEVSVVARCLRLGAADYLVKPLRTNELLNLWTHSWRRRHMAEKDYFNQSIGMIFSDHSDANTNSTTFLSEDTDDKIRTRHQEVTLLDQKDHEFDESRAESDQNILSEDNALQHSNHPVSSGKILSWPTKMDLKIGQSSAFITYVKSRAPTSHLDRDATPPGLLNGKENLLVRGNIESHFLENFVPSNEDVCNRSMLQDPEELPVIVRHASPCKHLLPRTEGQIDVLGMQPMFHVPFYLHGHPSSMQGVQGTLYDVPQSHHSPMMQHFAYYPVPISLPSGHRPLTHLYSSSTSSHMPQSTNGLAERRAAALKKFKQKKKERCYDKKIRYINRKRLAEKRPRVRGQFVRQVNDVDVQLNDSPGMNDYDSDEEEDEPLSREYELDSSPEHDTY
ncbi:two-component response regulator-like PRR1 isoform X2 [Dendrobium catenatum]|uniref:two-component response regulator-like PRR1 isoform X2 n=1 Tax=Dendrobium catenatum TaxID=906689 RepID=UPI0009F47FE0|nr:two-component response regulator-like PRR1 isoform X2 [Dendrobium catenatum]